LSSSRGAVVVVDGMDVERREERKRKKGRRGRKRKAF
jgi:hypothetical protein